MNESWLPPDPTGNRLGHVLDEEYDGWVWCPSSDHQDGVGIHECEHGSWPKYVPPYDYMNDDPFEGSRESNEYPND